MKINTLISAIALVICSNAVAYEDNYIIKFEAIGVQGAPTEPEKPKEPTGTSCLEIKKSNPDAATGPYTINQLGRQFRTICNMDVDGGGWTLVQKRANNTRTFSSTDDMTTIEFQNEKATGVADDMWMSLSAESTQLMMYFNSSAYAYMKIQRAKTANCVKLGGTLNRGTLWHHENAGCDMVGMDYSFMGHKGVPTFKNAVYTYSPGVFDKIVNVSGYYGANGMVFVR